MGKTYLTKDGLQKMQDEFKRLQKQKLELTDEVNKAAQMGDLRENAEYHAVRERLQHVSTRLSEMNAKLHEVELIDNLPVNDSEARVGALVTLQDIKTKEEFAYHLVGPDEADPAKGKLSIASPLGKSMLGKKPGEQFNLNLPRAIVPYRVVRIERPS